MPKVPSLSDDNSGDDEEYPPLIVSQPSDNSERDFAILPDDEDWALRWEIAQGQPAANDRAAASKQFLETLLLICQQRLDRERDEFPDRVVAWLAEECSRVLDGEGSALLRSPHEAASIADAARQNLLNLSEELWQASDFNPIYVLNAMARAHYHELPPPPWATAELTKAARIMMASHGEIPFHEAMGLTEKSFQKALAKQQKRMVANMVGEGIDAGLCQPDARELARFECAVVLRWRDYTDGTIQKYYEKAKPNDGDGYADSFAESFVIANLPRSAAMRGCWDKRKRAPLLKRRLEAHKKAADEHYHVTEETERARRQVADVALATTREFERLNLG